MVEGAAVLPKDAIEPLTKSVNWKKVKVLKRKAVATEELEESRKLGQDLFGKIGPESEDGLFAFIRLRLQDWEQKLKSYQPLADTGKYPGKDAIDAGCRMIEKLLAVAASYDFFQMFLKKKDDLHDLADDIHELSDFYTNQKATWVKLQKAMEGFFKLNRQELDKEEKASQALARMDEILLSKRPYGMIKEVEGLLNIVDTVNDALLTKRKEYAVAELDQKISQVMETLAQYKAEPDLKNKALKPLQDIKKHIQQEGSIPGIFYSAKTANEELEAVLDMISSRKDKGDKSEPAKPVKYIQPAKVSSKPYLETQKDIDDFIAALKKALEEALGENARIRIQ